VLVGSLGSWTSSLIPDLFLKSIHFCFSNNRCFYKSLSMSTHLFTLHFHCQQELPKSTLSKTQLIFTFLYCINNLMKNCLFEYDFCNLRILLSYFRLNTGNWNYQNPFQANPTYFLPFTKLFS